MKRPLLVWLALMSTAVLAQEERGPFVGVRVGQLDYEDTSRALIDFGDTTSNVTLSAGFRFNRALAFEGVYGMTSSIDKAQSGTIGTFRADNGVYVGGAYDAVIDGEIDFVEARVVTYAEHVLFGFGLFSMDISGAMTGTSEFQFDEIPQPPDAVFSNTLADAEHGYSLLVGSQWNLKDHWSIRAEYEYFDVSSPADLKLLGATMLHRF
jgi:opacity protein-like surface antigen